MHSLSPPHLSPVLFVASGTMTADSNGNSSGTFACASLSSISISTAAVLDVISSAIDLECNITGSGDVSLTCDHGAAIALGGDSNVHSPTGFYLSNSELAHVLSTGSLTIGSNSEQNVSAIWIDGVVWSPPAVLVSILSSTGSVNMLNTSSEVTLATSASLSIEAAQNITVASNSSISASGRDVVITLKADRDCSVETDEFTQDSHVTITGNSSFSVLTSDSQVVLMSPRLELDGVLNVSSAALLKLDGAFENLSITFEGVVQFIALTFVLSELDRNC